MKQTFYTCRHCGNLIAMLHDAGVPIRCCGENMQQLHPGEGEGSREKHTPVFSVEGNVAYVTVGTAAHPMTPEHFIQWICLETEKGVQYAHLTPGDKPEATFFLGEGDVIQGVYAFCNQHELWETR